MTHVYEESLIEWIKDYLSRRVQYVDFCGTVSDYNSINCGVPQGSILGPLLFLLYINDIANISNILFPVIFADDTNVFLKGNTVGDVMQTMNRELINVVE